MRRWPDDLEPPDLAQMTRSDWLDVAQVLLLSLAALAATVALVAGIAWAAS